MGSPPRKCPTNASPTTLPQTDPSDTASIIREVSEPLAAIVGNAQAGQRMGRAAGVDAELLEILSDITRDGKRAGDLMERLEAPLEKR